MACFSFFPSKNMTVAGDGGMIVTNDDKFGNKIQILKDHGRTDKFNSAMLGLNFRMSELHAALGRVQLKHLPDWIEARRKVAAAYNRHLAGIDGITLPAERDWAKHVYHLYVIQVEDREGLAEHLRSREIGTGLHYPLAVHQQDVMKPYSEGISLPVTERLVDRILSLPLYPDLSEEQVVEVAEEIKHFLS